MLKRRIIFALVTIGFVGSASAAETEPAEIDNGIIAKMARYRAKAAGDRDADGGGDSDTDRRRGGNTSNQCGAMNIGNFTQQRNRLGTPKEINVFITGDVINANNKCK